MALEWIIMKHDLLGSPIPKKIGRLTDTRDIGHTLGRLFLAWRWADLQSEDGIVQAELADLDDEVGCEGFGEAMIAVGWLIDKGDHLIFPNFGDHNGQTAKTRAKESLKKQRQRRARGTRGGHLSPECPEKSDKPGTIQNKTKQNTSTPPPPPSPETQLENAAAAGAGVMDLESWEKIGKRAGLERDLAGQCAETLLRSGVRDAETGLVALERLAEAVKGGTVKSPVGLLKSILGDGEIPEPAQKTVSRRRSVETRRKTLLDAAGRWKHPDWWPDVYRRARDTLPEGARLAVPDDPPERLADLPVAMLDFIAGNYDAITKPMLEKSA